jgi:hypothetical protein
MDYKDIGGEFLGLSDDKLNEDVVSNERLFDGLIPEENKEIEQLDEFFKQTGSSNLRLEDIKKEVIKWSKTSKYDIEDVKCQTKKVAVPKFSLSDGQFEFFRCDFYGSYMMDKMDEPLFYIGGFMINDFPVSLYLQATGVGIVAIDDIKQLKSKLTSYMKESKQLDEGLRSVKVTFDDGSSLTTSMASGLTDDQIKDYYKIGKEFNVGHIKDKMAKVKKVQILK